MNPAQGKLGYVLGLHALRHSVSQITLRVQERFPALVWPQGYSREEAVEIAVITYHEYAVYSGHISLCVLRPFEPRSGAGKTGGC